MSAERLTADLRDGVFWLTLNRPDKRNAIDSAMVDAFHERLDQADLDAHVRVVALRGAGKDFCAGADLAELQASAEGSLADNERAAQRLGDVFVRMRALPKPVVAVVHGRALAGGCGLATACDVVLAHADATFGYPEVRRGFVPAMVMAMLRRAVGEKLAFDLVTTGRLLTADEARALGLVARVYAGKVFESSVEEFVTDLAQRSPSALAFIKQQLYAIDGLSFAEAIAMGAKVNAMARTTPDFKQAVARFLEKS
ncbi:MAG: enoyl-CoA hydratase-related protein [Gemmatimonadota bacterium]|nr:enoyl-CoA hydratase-related protein [Gemmatimonadota bacterium]